MMKKFLIFNLLVCFICFSQQNKDIEKDLFKPSQKELNSNGLFSKEENISGNIYSNFKYNIALTFPLNWKFDKGVSKHTIFRAFEKDSGYSFSVNVIESKYVIESLFWKEYEKNKSSIQKKMLDGLITQLNTQVILEYWKESYLKNYKVIEHKYNYIFRDGDYEIDMTILMIQVPKGNFTYTFSLSAPVVFYNERPDYFENIIKDIYWLKDKNKTNEIILNQKN